MDIGEAGEWSRRPGHLVWIGLYEPSEELLAQVQAQFGLHPLAIHDAKAAHQRPKLERYGDCTFVVTRTAQLVGGRIALGETHLFVGQGFVVTVRHGASVAEGDGLLIVQERRHQGRKNDPNLIRILSREWLAWIKRGRRSAPKPEAAHRGDGPGGSRMQSVSSHGYRGSQSGEIGEAARVARAAGGQQPT